jgi:fatty-acyl-CoA synthase
MTEGDISAARAVHGWARTAGTSTAVVDEDTEISYARLAAEVRSSAAAFAAGGVRRGDRIAYLGRNSATLLSAALAAVHLGAIFVPLNFRLTGPELAHLLDDSGAHTLLADGEFRPVVDGIADLAVRRLLLVDAGPAGAPARSVGPPWEHLSAAVGSGADGRHHDPVPVRPDEAALIMYTSGTTGRPKGAVLTHGNLWWNEVNTAAVIETRLRDTALVAAPMFHIAGLSGFTLGTLTHGGTLVLRRAFDPGRCLADLVAHRVANLIAVPTMFAAIARSPGFADADLSALRGAIIGGAPVPVRLVREYAACGITLQPAWGLTETAPLASYTPARLVDRHPDAAGYPLPYTELRLVDPAQGAVVTAPGEPGEICVRGPNVISRYWNDPAATRGAIDEAGWFRSGDIGHVDEHGLLHVVDRLKDVIISGGENVYPAEIELLLADLPGVREVAVVGVPHPRWDETPVAVLVQDGGPRATVEDVRGFVGDRLARFKLPTALHHLDALPRTGSGKVDKAAIRASLLGGSDPAVSSPGGRPAPGAVPASSDAAEVPGAGR